MASSYNNPEDFIAWFITFNLDPFFAIDIFICLFSFFVSAFSIKFFSFISVDKIAT